MKLKNIKEVEEFRKVIHACAGDVYLKSQDGDVFNLKSCLLYTSPSPRDA